MLAKIAQAIPAMCDPELKIEGTQFLAIQQVESTTVEREGYFSLRQAWVKTSLRQDLEPML